MAWCHVVPTSSNTSDTSMVYLYPFHTLAASAAAPSSANGNFTELCDYFNYFSPLFGKFRGSMRIKMSEALDTTFSPLTGIAAPYPLAFNATTRIFSVSTSTSVPVYNSFIGNAAITSNPCIPYNSGVNHNPEYNVPYQSDRHVSVNTLSLRDDDLTTLYHKPRMGLFVQRTTNTNALGTVNPTYYRQIGEDFSFGEFLTTMPLVYCYPADVQNYSFTVT